MNLSERVASARRAQGLTQHQLAKLAGVSQQAVANIEIGSTRASSYLVPLARALGVSAEWLFDGVGPMSTSSDGWTNVRGSAQAAGMGPGREAEAYAETYHLKFRARSLANQGLVAERLEVCYGEGESMLPRICHGDAILFDRGDTKPAHNKVYVVRYDGHVFAKRLKKFGRNWFLVTDNPEADPDWREPKPVFDDDEALDFEILGRVRWIGSWEK